MKFTNQLSPDNILYICSEYQSTKITIKELAEKYNSSDDVIFRLLKLNNIIKLRHLVYDVESICNEYINTNISHVNLGKKHNTTPDIISAILKENNSNFKNNVKPKYNYHIYFLIILTRLFNYYILINVR